MKKLTCEQCGKVFETYKGKQRFCSQDCYSDHCQAKIPKYTCKNCGEEFRARPEKNRIPTYCSIKCTNTCKEKKRKPRTWVKSKANCVHCGKEFEWFKRPSTTRKYCSVACANKHRWEVKKDERA